MSERNYLQRALKSLITPTEVCVVQSWKVNSRGRIPAQSCGEEKLPVDKADGPFLFKPGAALIIQALKLVCLRRVLIILSATRMATSFIQEVTALSRPENTFPSRSQKYPQIHTGYQGKRMKMRAASQMTTGENHGRSQEALNFDRCLIKTRRIEYDIRDTQQTCSCLLPPAS